MSFRCRQKFHTSPCSGVGSFEQKTLETGVVVTEVSNDCDKELPKPELFDLQTNLEAGVNLEEVGSKILQADSISLDFLNQSVNSQVDNSVNNKQETNKE